MTTTPERETLRLSAAPAATATRGEAASGGGYAMAVLLVAMSIMAVMLTVVMPVWKQMAQREKEAELVFRGEQYARSIGLFQKKYANAFPPNLDVLVEQRFLRKKYKDPITNSDFVPLLQGQGTAGATPGSGSQTAARPGQTPSPIQSNPATGPRPTTPATPATSPTGGIGTPGAGPTGGINGVASKSKDTSIRLYKGRSHYNEWAFVFTPPAPAPGAAGAPGAPGGDAAAPAARNLREGSAEAASVDAAAPGDAADRVVRMDPAVVVLAGTRCFRRTPEPNRALLAVKTLGERWRPTRWGASFVPDPSSFVSFAILVTCVYTRCVSPSPGL